MTIGHILKRTTLKAGSRMTLHCSLMLKLTILRRVEDILRQPYTDTKFSKSMPVGIRVGDEFEHCQVDLLKQRGLNINGDDAMGSTLLHYIAGINLLALLTLSKN